MKVEGGEETLKSQIEFGKPVGPLLARPTANWRPESIQVDEKLFMHNTLANYWRFLLAGIIKQGQTGAVIPSQRFLIARMIEPAPAGYRGQILELGAGPGALTQRLPPRRPLPRIRACEIHTVAA